MNVLFVVAEMAPLVKVGGIGDVGGSLPSALRQLGHDVRVAIPYYGAIKKLDLPVEHVVSLPDAAAAWRTVVGGVPVYLVDCDLSFGGDAIYGGDETARFLAFCDGLAASATGLGWQPHLLHLHDWHPGFIAMRLAADKKHPWSGLPQVQTIHNLAFTGAFDAQFAITHALTGLAAAPELKQELRCTALAQAIMRADLVSTASPTYACEIVGPDFGYGFEGLLGRLGNRLSGIMNGIDTTLYDPATDAQLASTFDSQTLDRRDENKRSLQASLGLSVDPRKPLVGMVSRLYWQKGPDLAAGAIEQLLESRPLQFVVLGQGDDENERQLEQLADRYPRDVAVRLDFDESLARRIYGGSDIYLMPSRYEPCGLSQMIAMHYGAIPVVRRTGGLADSVAPYDARQDEGTGFTFEDATVTATADALAGALAIYEDRRAWQALQRRGMAQDWSWARSAVQYAELYQRAVHMRANPSQRAGNQR